MAIKTIDTTHLSNIADAIREKNGTSAGLAVEEMANNILAIESKPDLQDKTVTPSTSTQIITADSEYGGLGEVTVNAIPDQYIDTSDATAAAADIMSGETAYVDGAKITGTFSIDTEISAQDNLITQLQSVVDSLPEASGEPILQNKTINPTVNTQTITADSGYDGLSTVIVNGDTNLVAANIAEGVSIFGVTGTHSGSGSIETCTVKITDTSGYSNMVRFAASIITNGVINAVDYSSNANSTITIDNVICGSAICITLNNTAYAGCSVSTNNLIAVMSGEVYKITSSGTTGTFIISQ